MPDPRKTHRHQKMRLGEIAASPYCRRCQRARATQIHHIIPIAVGGSAFDPANRVPLCAPCHRAEHRKPTFFLERS